MNISTLVEMEKNLMHDILVHPSSDGIEEKLDKLEEVQHEIVHELVKNILTETLQ